MSLVQGETRRMAVEKNGWPTVFQQQKKSMFTSHRANRFNNTFENPVALLYHHKDAVHFLTYKVTNSNKKLLSIIYDLEDKHIVSILAAVSLLAVHLTSPYWKLMNSRTPYGQFSKHVQSMKSALQRWSSEDFDISNLQHESPVFGLEFQTSVEIPTNFLQTDFCLKDVTSNAFREICQRCLIVTDRQLADFLPGGVYGETLPEDLQQLLDRCPLTNLIGERMFGDLDYDMNKRRSALTHTRSSLNMCKHNRLSSYLDKLSPSLRKKSMASGRKYGKSLKRKHCEAVKAVREQKKLKIDENERKKKEKDLVDKEKHLALLTDIVSQGGLCSTKQDLRILMNQPRAVENLKIQIRCRKYYLGAQDLKLAGNKQVLLNCLCNHLGIDYDENEDVNSEDEEGTNGESDDDDDDGEFY